MSSVMPEPTNLYVGSRETWISAPGGQLQRNEHTDPLAGATDALKRLGSEGRRWWRPRVRVWLSGALARPFVLGPVAGLRGLDDSLALARSTVQESTGLCEPVALWLDGNPARRSVLAVAVDARLLDGVVVAAREHRVRIAALRPWWSWAQRELLRSDPSANFVFIEEADAATLLVARGPAWRTAMTYDPAPSSIDVEAILERHAILAEEPVSGIRRAALGASVAPMVKSGSS